MLIRRTWQLAGLAMSALLVAACGGADKPPANPDQTTQGSCGGKDAAAGDKAGSCGAKAGGDEGDKADKADDKAGSCGAKAPEGGGDAPTPEGGSE